MNKIQKSIFDDTVAARIEALLARCDRVRRASDLDKPVVFNADGERHAASVAAAEAGRKTTSGSSLAARGEPCPAKSGHDTKSVQAKQS